MTRHPSNEQSSHIDVALVEGNRNAGGVNEAEVVRCMTVLDELVAAGWDSIGLVSPFRSQADAMEKAVMEKFTLEEIERLSFRVGTAHSFQGAERRAMVMSWAIGFDEGAKPWQFVNQPNLFNVMVTRAQERVVIVTSVKKPPGLAGEYMRWADSVAGVPSRTETTAETKCRWSEGVAAALRDAGLTVRTDYQVGRYSVDVVAGIGDRAVAIDCVPHEDGPAAHIDRAMQLRRMGWRTTDAYESRWRDRLSDFVAEFERQFPNAG